MVYICITIKSANARSFGSHEVPLTAIPPTRSVHRAALTSAWKHARWENGIHGGQLTAGDDPFGWGIGVHAHHELEFDLPAAVRTFRTRFALDASAGGGGCVRAIVYNGSTDTEPLFESRPIIGSRTVTDTAAWRLRRRSRIMPDWCLWPTRCSTTRPRRGSARRA